MRRIAVSTGGALSELDFPVVGVASTIDNDLYGSEITIGVDTALNVALEASTAWEWPRRRISGPSSSR